MGKFIYEKKIPSVDEYQFLRNSVGWDKADQPIVELALKNTLFAVCAYTLIDNQYSIIGSGRVVGDKGLAFYIQDLMVHPSYQRNMLGVGYHIMKIIIKYVDQAGFPYSDVGFMSAKGLEHFYRKLGWIERPCADLGSGFSYKIER